MKQIWDPIFNKYLGKEQMPNFSIYRKPYDMQMRKNKDMNQNGQNYNEKRKS